MPYTTHGHWYGPGEPTQPGPRLVAKCFGLGGCYDCRTEAGLPPLSKPKPEPKTITVYASIGNSDDKLTQAEWSGLTQRFQSEINEHADRVHGVWYSAPESRYQNACACFEVAEERAPYLRECLALVCRDFRQESIAWAVVQGTEFVTAGEAVDRG